jgi:cysteine desulfurase / selenocysteine lyase
MSTSERDSTGLPAELRLANGHTPKPMHVLEVPTHAPTPGLSTAPAKHPGAPTVPDGDPISMVSLIQQMANALFQSPGDLPPSDASLPGQPHEVVQTSPAATSKALTDRGVEPATVPFPVSPTAYHDAFGAIPRSDELSMGLVDRSASGRSDEAPPIAPFFAPLDLASLFPESSLVDSPTRGSKHGVAETPVPVAQGRDPQAISPRFSDAYELSPSAHGYQHATPTLFDPHALKREFPILQQTVHGKPLVWLDNAATTQKPRAVIDRLRRFYDEENSNIHRAAHTLAARATDAYEGARSTVRRFLNAPSNRDLIFVRGATEGINLVAKSWGARQVQAGDEIVISWLEHHANIVPWQQLANEKGATLRVAPVDDRGQIILEAYEGLLSSKTKLVAFTQVSNALGTMTPAKEMVRLAHRHGAKVLVDGAQAVSHLRVDVQDLDCDFFVFSGHKVFAPTGIGVVFARSELMDATPPWQGGGNMIQDVTFERTVFHPSPARFEAGTGNIADAVALGTALDWLTGVGLETVAQYEHQLLEYATEQLLTVSGLTLYGTAPEKAGVLSFTLKGQPTEQMSALLDRDGIAVRSGHHCAQPILRRFGVEATVRASFAPYNTMEDVDTLVASLRRLQEGR